MCRSVQREGWDPHVVRRPRELQRAAQPVRSADEARASGGLVVVADDHVRENGGDLIAAGFLITVNAVTLMVRHTIGIPCAPMPAALVRGREPGDMVPDDGSPGSPPICAAQCGEWSVQQLSCAERLASSTPQIEVGGSASTSSDGSHHIF
ncbi:3,4-dihydroxy-2-butanone-4-phosphate synthase [Pseudonocardia benzenivorans]|uniref:3,4-dihydroxy-2-butanone-4-phosphate synthase n=1 Tax=Pseudonocardia benzenivorans TaxID=228005 RepID=A0ABW3VFC5_9PSEU